MYKGTSHFKSDQLSYGPGLHILNPYNGPNLLLNKNKTLDSLKYDPIYFQIYWQKYDSLLWGEPDNYERLEKGCHDFYDMDHNIIHIHTLRQIVRIRLFEQALPLKGSAFDNRLYIKLGMTNGPSFANWLKKARQAMIIKTLSSRLTEDNKTFISNIEDNIYGISFNENYYDYDAIMHEQHQYDFIEEANDLQWSFEEITEDEDWISAFKIAALNLLTRHKLKDINPASSSEMRTWISDSVTRRENGDPILNRRLMREIASEKKVDELINHEQSYFHFFRQSVYVSPANARDTWQCDIHSLFKVKRISFLLRSILEEIPSSAMASASRAHARRKKILKKKESSFLMFDFKKCGLTMNRNLIVILGDILNEMYPGKGFIEMTHFKNVILRNGTVDLYPLRGVGLGNCNEGVTLVQCVIGELFKLKYGFDAIFFNDDGVYLIEDEIRAPISFIVTAMNKLGLILNLEKTIISKHNIFCEDYFISSQEEFGFKKNQNLLIPFGNIFFKENILQAKCLYNDLSRGIIGRRVFPHILPSLVRVYGYEFHKHEYTWPFEFGGWEYKGKTSMNEAIYFLFNWEGLSVEEQSSIPLFREWAYYLIRVQEIRRFSRQKDNISYRRFIPNPFKVPEEKSLHSEQGMEDLKMLGINNSNQRISAYDDLYNLRGLKNAKPTIKMGKAKKLLSYRENIWKKFKQYRLQGRHVMYPHAGSAMQCLNYLRNEEIAPQMYVPPDFLVSDWDTQPFEDLIPMGRLLQSPPKKKIAEYELYGLFQTIESIHMGFLLRGSQPFCLRDILSKNKSRSIISNYTLYDTPEPYYVPDWLYLFIPKKRCIRPIYYQICGKFPKRWEELPDFNEFYRKFKNPVKYIFPECNTNLEKLYNHLSERNDRKEILDLLYDREYRDAQSFNYALTYLIDYLYQLEEIELDRTVRVRTLDPLYEIEIDLCVADQILGDRTFEDELEDYTLDQIYEDYEDLQYEERWSEEDEPTREDLIEARDPYDEDYY